VKIVAEGILNAAEPRGHRAVSIYPTITALENGGLVATYMVGPSKDSDCNTIELRWSLDNGVSWGGPTAPFSTTLDGRRGSLLAAYLTPISNEHLIVVAAWVDRQAHPGRPLFNPDTEGTLPMEIVLADSHDSGQTWSSWRVLSVPKTLGPPAVTALLRLLEGGLVLSFETGKHYNDASKWYQKVWWCHSRDQGRTWTIPVPKFQDPNGRIFHWDQKAGVSPDGQLVTFAWTYDHETRRYLNIHRRTSSDEGKSWTDPEDLGISDQPSHPAILPDGRVVLAWVDRFNTGTIRARLSKSIHAPFLAETEITIYEHPEIRETRRTYKDTGELLSDLHLWTFGHPHAEALPSGEVMVVFYAGTNGSLSTRWVRVSL